MTKELNIHRHGWHIDWPFLIAEDNYKTEVRPGDTLTINCLEDLGPKTIRAAVCIWLLQKRGIVVDYSAVAADGVELIARHYDEIVKTGKVRKMNRARELSGNKGGRPRKYADADIRAYHDAVRTGRISAADLGDVYVIAPSTMADNCDRLNLVWPITNFDSTERTKT